jgi:ABC-2 type transport system permease protein
VRSVFLRELSAFFMTPVFYAVTGVFLCMSGVYFFHAVVSVSLMASQIAQTGLPGGMSMNGLLLKPLFADLSTLVIFLCPLVTMRLFSEDALQPRSPHQASGLRILLGKYLAALGVVVAMLALSTSLMAVLSALSSPDWGLIVSSYLGLVLMAGSVLAMGTFASSLAKQQSSAAALTMGLALLFWTIGWFAPMFPEGRAASVLQELSLSHHLSSFLEGVISLRDIAFFLEMAVFFLALTIVFLVRTGKKG